MDNNYIDVDAQTVISSSEVLTVSDIAEVLSLSSCDNECDADGDRDVAPDPFAGTYVTYVNSVGRSITEVVPPCTSADVFDLLYMGVPLVFLPIVQMIWQSVVVIQPLKQMH